MMSENCVAQSDLSEVAGVVKNSHVENFQELLDWRDEVVGMLDTIKMAKLELEKSLRVADFEVVIEEAALHADHGGLR